MPPSAEPVIGPVDVAVLYFEGNQFNGDVAPALAELEESGVVRIIDLALLAKDLEGNVAVVEIEDADIAEAFADINRAPLDLLSEDDLAGLADSLDNDSSALVVVWENAWAARLAVAVSESKGRLVALERIPRETVLAALAALDEE